MEEWEDKKREEKDFCAVEEKKKINACELSIWICINVQWEEGVGVFSWRQWGWLIRKSYLLANGF